MAITAQDPSDRDICIAGAIAPGDPVIDAVYAHWRARCPPGGIPDRAAIDPVEIPPACLPHLILWDRLEAGGYRCRLSGSAVDRAHGRGLRGLTTAELHGASNGAIEREYDWVVANRLPHFVDRRMAWYHQDFKRYRRILLPLTQGGTEVRMLLAAATYYYGTPLDPRAEP
ncbi:MAG TPA: PAS domain-containing protein [Alphaproteobacteria bacterium]|nr:PAS domain-containing protein [Alphaproteobacteria bacterium]